VRLGAMDLISLDVGGTVIERLDQAVEELAEDENDGEEELATPLAIAVDMEGDAPAAAPSPDTDNPAP
jgi:exoribonuclease-2